MSLMGLLVFVLVIVLLIWLVRQIPDPTIQRIALIIVIVIAIVWLLEGLGAVHFLNEPLRIR